MSLEFEDIGTDSPASVSDNEVQPVPQRGRGKGRGRGRGRGRGGRRGGRLYRGQRFEEDEEKRLVHLHEDRKERADVMIESMTEAEAKTMLKEVAARQPAVILDIAALLSKRQQPQPENPDEPMPGSQAPSWSVCTKCLAMDREEDKVCCGMSPQYCNSLRPEMGLVVTDPLTLHIQQTYRNDVFAHRAETLEDTNKAMRHAAYRQYVLWIFGRLQKDDRRTVPACCVQAWAVDRWISGGAPRNKLILGLTGSATSFTLMNRTATAVGSPVQGPGKAGPYLGREGHVTYYRVCEMIKNGAIHRWDDEQKMAYAYMEDQWVGYGNQKSMKEKVKFAYSRNIAGVMFWSIDQDDFLGHYCNAGEFPLLTAIYNAIIEMAPKDNHVIVDVSTSTTHSTTPIDFHLHHKTNKNGINFYDMVDNGSVISELSYCLLIFCFSVFAVMNRQIH